MVSGISRTKLEVYNTVNSQLLDVFQAPCTQMLPQLQGKIAGCVTFLLMILQQHDMHYVRTLGDSLCVCVWCHPCVCACICHAEIPVWCGSDSHFLTPRKLFHHPHRFLPASACKSASGLHGQSMHEVYGASSKSGVHMQDRHSYKDCMQAEIAGFGADSLNAGTTVITTVANTAYAHVGFCEKSICTLLFRSYRFATRMPSTRCRRHATSPATSAVAMRCFTILSNHQSKLSQTAACSNSTRADIVKQHWYDHGTGKINLGKLHAS